MPPLTPLRIGLLGWSDIARRRFAPAIPRAGATLTAIGTRRRSGDIPVPEIEAVTDTGMCPLRPEICTYDQLLARPDVDLIYNSLPNDLHEHWTLRALAAGKHVLCEKPLAPTLDSVERMIEAARKARRLLYENLMFLHHPQHQIIRDLLSAGRIGKLQSVRSTFTFQLNPAPPNFRNDPARGGGACADLLTYTVGTTELFNLGELRDITGTITHRNGLDLTATGTAQLPGDIPFHFTISFDAPYESAYELIGETGCLRLDRAYTTPPDLANTLLIRTGEHEERRPLPTADHFAETIRHVARLIATDDFASVNATTLHRHQTIARVKSSLRAS